MAYIDKLCSNCEGVLPRYRKTYKDEKPCKCTTEKRDKPYKLDKLNELAESINRCELELKMLIGILSDAFDTLNASRKSKNHTYTLEESIVASLEEFRCLQEELAVVTFAKLLAILDIIYMGKEVEND